MSGFRWPAADKVPRFPREKTSGTQGKSDKTIYTTSNNQSLRSAGDNNRKSKEGRRTLNDGQQYIVTTLTVNKS